MCGGEGGEVNKSFFRVAHTHAHTLSEVAKVSTALQTSVSMPTVTILSAEDWRAADNAVARA